LPVVTIFTIPSIGTVNNVEQRIGANG